MINNKKVLGIIPARKGSKGLRGKNSKIFCGKPLLEYAIEAGTSSKFIDHLILSSDCEICIEIADKANVDVPFKRPKSLSGDKVSSIKVIEHAINFLRKENQTFDFVVLIEPTSPLRTSEDIDNALKLMVKKGKKSIVSLAKAEDQHPNFMFKIEKGIINPYLQDSFRVLRRQDVDEAFYLDGSVYISDIDELLREKTFYRIQTLGFIMPKWKALEIDDQFDFICAEAIYKYLQNEIDEKQKNTIR